MARYYGAIGYAKTVETSPGVWKEDIEERKYSGELTQNSSSFNSSGQVNDNVNIANKISIIADPYAYNNFHSMRYIEFMGSKWKISRVEDHYPRLILTIGGVYNG